MSSRSHASFRLRRAAWPILGACCALHLAAIWFLPVPYGQDMPQHLAYAHVLRHLGDPELPFARYFEVSRGLSLYSTAHFLIGWFSFDDNVTTGARCLQTLYVLALLGSAFALCRAALPRAPHLAPTASLFAVPLVVSPVTAMGFIPFAIALPFFLAAVASFIAHRQAPTRSLLLAHVAAALTGAVLHPFVAGCVFLFGLSQLPSSHPRSLRAVAPSLVIGPSALLVGILVAPSHLGTFGSTSIGGAIRSGFGLTPLALLFGAEWSSPISRLNFALWTFGGPYRVSGLLVLLTLGAGVLFYTWRSRRTHPLGQDAAERSLLWAGGVFLALAFVTPSAINVPTQLSYIEMRLTWIGAALLMAAMAIRAAQHSTRGHLLFLLFCVGHTLVFARSVVTFADESRDALAVIDSATPRGVMRGTTLHPQSDAFAGDFRSHLHTVMYYTIRRNGIVADFWAGSVAHLPVRYRVGMRVPEAPPAAPGAGAFGPPRVLYGVDHVLAHFASESQDPTDVIAASDNLRGRLGAFAREVVCQGAWCLYEATDGNASSGIRTPETSSPPPNFR